MGLIPQDVIDQVLAAYDVVDVVGRYVPLKPAGRSFKALCPFHEEKTPSFTVNPDRQTFKCFGCGKGGDIFRFLMEQEGLTFPEAVRTLARDRGITVPEVHGTTPEAEGRVEAVRRALTAAQAFFVRCLQADEGREARAYLTKRGYDEEAVRRFGLGYAPAAWDRLLQAATKRGVDGTVLEDAGLAVLRPDGGHYDRFRHRVLFPIADLQGRVITFGARALNDEDQPKYLNGPETVVFKKANVLYALDRARDGIRKHAEGGQALLMEGYTDVLTCHLHGIDRAVAGMGTAFTPQQARLLKRFTKRVVLVYDGDEAGRTAAERTLDILLPEGLEVRVVLLPRGLDVDEILLEEGPEAFEKRIAEARDALDFKLEVLEQKHDRSTPQGLAQIARSVVATIVKVPNFVVQAEFFRRVSEQHREVSSEQAFRDEARRRLGEDAERALYRSRRAKGAEQGPTVAGSSVLSQRMRREAEEFLLAGYLLYPDQKEAIRRSVGPEDFTVPVLRRIYNAALDLEEAGEACDLRVMTARLAEDAEAQEVLAGLPEDPTLEERIPFQIEFLERKRGKKRQVLEIRQQLAEAEPTSGAGGLNLPGGETQVGERSDGTASREQVG